MTAIVSAVHLHRPTTAISHEVVGIRIEMSLVVERLGVTEDTSEQLSVDGSDLPSGTELESVCGDAIGVS